MIEEYENQEIVNWIFAISAKKKYLAVILWTQ